MTYDEAIEYVLDLELDDLITDKALNYIEFIREVNLNNYGRHKKLTANEEKRLREIIESK